MKRNRVTVLVENTARGSRLLAEHGLALWVELGHRRVLFDAGQTGILRHNATLLGIDVASVDAVVLSHGHYDHTGGLDAVLNRITGAQVFAHPDAFGDKYARNANGIGREIGMPLRIREEVRRSVDIKETREPTEVCEGFCVTGPIPRCSDFEDTGGPFFQDALCSQPDALTDDQAGFVETSDGTIVILGCAHAGIVNTLRYVSELLPRSPIHTVIGGTHLVTANDTRIQKTVEALREFDVQRLAPLHCTGFPAAARLWKAFPKAVSACYVGCSI